MNEKEIKKVQLKNGEKYFRIQRNSEYNGDKRPTCLVVGKPITIPFLPEYKFFTQRTEKGLWSLSEVSTGLSLIRNKDKRKELIDSFKKHVDTCTIKRFKELVKKAKKVDEYINDVARIKKEKEILPYVLITNKIDVSVMNNNDKLNVQACLVIFNDYKEFTFIVYKTDNRKWCCYEYKTGLSVSSWGGTRKGCINNTLEKFAKMPNIRKTILSAHKDCEILNK